MPHMENRALAETVRPSGSGAERFEPPIAILAFALYVLERCLAFAFLLNRAEAGGGWESRLLAFLFGSAPYSILDILFGFDTPAGWIGFLSPRNILQAVLQVVHFLINWQVVKFFLLLVATKP